jgi:hypothetical protein
MKCKLLTFIPLFLGISLTAQLTVDVDMRSRAEYRHGFSTLIPTDTDPAFFVQQRTRLKTGFKSEKVEVFLSIQDIRVWGDVAQLNSSDVNGFSVHEAWAKVPLGKGFAAKVGRQEVALDDHRILGNVDWAMQARSHDMIGFTFDKGNFKSKLGAAFNQDGVGLSGNTLTNPKTYKTMQFLWLNHKINEFKISVLVLNNGVQYIHDSIPERNEVRFSQTVGTHLEWKKGILNIAANGYFQTGEDRSGTDIEAFLAGLEIGLKKENWAIALGGELQSGNKLNDANTNTSFTPLYGTNHKFNGHLDYFYVGNHVGNAGLQDLYLKLKGNLGKKASVTLMYHNFSTAQTFAVDESSYLGDEIDLMATFKVNSDVIIKAGYSHMLQQKGMKLLKGVDNNEVNNWGWVMLVIKPRIFSTAKKVNP